MRNWLPLPHTLQECFGRTDPLRTVHAITPIPRWHFRVQTDKYFAESPNSESGSTAAGRALTPHWFYPRHVQKVDILIIVISEEENESIYITLPALDSRSLSAIQSRLVTYIPYVDGPDLILVAEESSKSVSSAKHLRGVLYPSK